MDKIDAIGFGIIGLILIGLFVILYSAIKHENHTIEQSDNLEKICLKAYKKSDLKNDNEIKELCKNVKVKLFEDR